MVQAIARVIGADKRENEYLESNNHCGLSESFMCSSKEYHKH